MSPGCVSRALAPKVAIIYVESFASRPARKARSMGLVTLILLLLLLKVVV